jgi:hypothetical protein
MPKINPKTQAVVDAFMDVDALEGIRARRRAELQELRPKLYNALKELVDALYGDEITHPKTDGEVGAA